MLHCKLMATTRSNQQLICDMFPPAAVSTTVLIESSTSESSIESDDSDQSDEVDIVYSESSSMDSREHTPRAASPMTKKRRKDTSKHGNQFKPEWKSKFPWIKFEGYSTGMFCSLCCSAQLDVRSKSGVWVRTGCKSYRMDKVKKHEKTQAHKDACVVALSSSSGGLESAFREQVLANRAAVLCSMTCLYFLVKSEIPHTANFLN